MKLIIGLTMVICGTVLLIASKLIDLGFKKRGAFSNDDETILCPHCNKPTPKLSLECLECRKRLS